VTDVVDKGVLRGRPFGGIGILIRNCLFHKMSCLVEEERFIIVSVSDTVFVNVYLPVCMGDVLQAQIHTSMTVSKVNAFFVIIIVTI